MTIAVSTRHIRVFLAVAAHGSTAAAARALALSQPSVSVALRELETLLGQPLFLRQSARGLAPTAFGLRKLGEAREIAARLATFARTEAADEGPAGEVTFGYFSTLGPLYVPQILRRMADRHPQIHVTLREGDLSDLNRLIETGTIELALSYAVSPSPHAATETLAELEPHAVLPAGHRLAALPSVPVALLAQEPFILIDLPQSREFLLSVFRAEGREARIAYRTPSIDMALGMVAAGLGVSVLVTRQTASHACEDAAIRRLPLRDNRVRQGVVLARPAQHQLTGPARALATCIREVVAEA
ncbi:putative transcriptional regulator, LysR family [Novosphingobium nitrogenifigens DSM 19370]|uniref:Putative transcriptional regulator, LysR family n=1 Tax=Novosphingobium nitrogenifigens DSM 19370 TaxID=983920 RepID=F1ZBV1_9SPHN|nr:LysR substrate-binding domain-containing protein [Novosphingobium nitrogenifigens]EGD57973.1 putative transcriptional regulator, LysR family [Novosphingobium nitrogenifigens DSM 19370]